MPVPKNFAVCLVAAGLLASSACTIDLQGEETVVREQKRIALNGMPNVTIRTFDGSVELRSWERNEILVDIERRASNAEDARQIVVRTTEESGNVLIEAEPPRRSGDLIQLGRRRSPSVHMVVTLPARLNVDAQSGDGNIAARDLTGRIELRTGDGAVALRNLDGEINIHTGDGSVAASDVQGTLAISTGDGAVEVSGRLDSIVAHSGDGGIRIDARPGSTMRREWTITSGDGGVTLRLPPDFNASIDAHTGDGAITTSGVILTGAPEAREHGILRGQTGKGGEVLTLRTGDGPINIVAR
jgi:DUF4097 and DUF4098 domain-containing protein YvlB